MSGGSYDYVSYKIDDAASALRGRHPKEPHVIALAGRLEELSGILHDIEWADSGDTSWTAALDARIRSFLAPGVEIEAAVAMANTARAALDEALRAATPPEDGNGK